MINNNHMNICGMGLYCNNFLTQFLTVNLFPTSVYLCGNKIFPKHSLENFCSEISSGFSLPNKWNSHARLWRFRPQHGPSSHTYDNAPYTYPILQQDCLLPPGHPSLSLTPCLSFFLAVLGLHCCCAGFLSLQWVGFSLQWLPLQHSPGSRAQGCNSCGTRTQEAWGIWELPRLVTKPVSHALQGEFSTTGPPEKPCLSLLFS